MPLSNAEPTTYPVVDTGQTSFFDGMKAISKPRAGSAFDGQDASFARNPPRYADNGDGTVTDEVTGLVWQKGFAVMTYQEALRKQKVFSLGGKTDWRLPDIKELYSLALFSGVDASGPGMERVPKGAKPFLDAVFGFEYGSNGPRTIDTQLLSSTIYQGKTMGGMKTVFGFNAADGRIKGYPVSDPRTRSGKRFTVRFVRGNPEYGKNKLHDHGDGTIHDNATGLMWEKADSGRGMDWKNALAWVRGKNAEKYLGHDDWRLPNAKELHSIVDVTRGPQSTKSAAISPLFEISQIKDEAGRDAFPSFWTSTTHQNTRGGTDAVYICFGEALGWFKPPGAPGSPRLLDVHGAGAQRSDPKTGGASRFPRGRGPQGDVVRSKHHVRMVRDIRP
ncbi:MAG: DUF1566 domain-containing protein [Akkermansiaceae bacterium]|nr:DUF1566 domain-containing protein [Akkermansiaceae bacterium]MCP5546137.1 DUF1566 domain-containing protein [Akkermansiaceae bacterium]